MPTNIDKLNIQNQKPSITVTHLMQTMPLAGTEFVCFKIINRMLLIQNKIHEGLEAMEKKC